MRKIFISLLFLGLLAVPGLARSEKANTVLIHPGETIYARFERKGRSLKLITASPVKDEAAQLIFQMSRWDREKSTITLQVENKFDKDLDYEAEMRLLKPYLHQPTPVSPIVAGKFGMESWSTIIQELALAGFKLEN